MQTIPLLQHTLGEQWFALPEVIQRHYNLDPDQTPMSTVRGTMYVRFPWYALPMLKIARIMGALIDINSEGLWATVSKQLGNDASTLHWRRDIKTQTDQKLIFASRMEYLSGNELIEFVGFGFGIRLKLSVEDGCLVYRSNGHLWQLGSLRIPIPDVLFLGHATITETAIDDQRFELDFKIVHPFFGQTYAYGGLFHHETAKTVL